VDRVAHEAAAENLEVARGVEVHQVVHAREANQGKFVFKSICIKHNFF
jgi:hypothetical protein